MVKPITDAKFAKTHAKSICVYLLMETAFGKTGNLNSPKTLTAIPKPKAMLGEVLETGLMHDWSFTTSGTTKGKSLFRVRLSNAADLAVLQRLFEIWKIPCKEPGCTHCFQGYYTSTKYGKFAKALGHV